MKRSTSEHASAATGHTIIGAGRQSDVLADRAVAVGSPAERCQCQLVAQESHAGVGCELCQLNVIKAHTAAIGRFKAGEDPQQRRLAGAAKTPQADEVVLEDLE